MRMTITLALRIATIVLLTLWPGWATCQDTSDIKVRLLVSEDSEGIVREAFSNALAELGDVALSDLNSRPDFTIDVLSQCLVDRCLRSAVSVTLGHPVGRSTVIGALVDAGFDLESVSPAQLEHVVSDLENYSASLWGWLIIWEPDRMEEEVRRLVSVVDRRCFERTRLSRSWTQAQFMQNDARADALWRRLDQGNWIC